MSVSILTEISFGLEGSEMKLLSEVLRCPEELVLEKLSTMPIGELTFLIAGLGEAPNKVVLTPEEYLDVLQDEQRIQLEQKRMQYLIKHKEQVRQLAGKLAQVLIDYTLKATAVEV